MIRYELKCAEGHRFEAWFPSGADYEAQSARGLVACSVCGATSVEKALMAPRVPKKGGRADAGEEQPQPVLSAPAENPIERKMAELRDMIEKNSDDVGDRFAVEARAMHVGDKEHRPIRGRATGEEAKSLIDDGVPVAPLPNLPRRNG